MTRKTGTVAPYTKYNKVPFKYSQDYYDWRRAIKNGDRVAAIQSSDKIATRAGCLTHKEVVAQRKRQGAKQTDGWLL